MEDTSKPVTDPNIPSPAPSSPSPTATPDPMAKPSVKKNNRRLLILGGITLLLLLALGAFAYWYYTTRTASQSPSSTMAPTPTSSNTSPTPTISVTPIATSTATPTSAMVPAGWDTYTNNKYKFSISFPKPFKALDDPDSLSGWPNGVVLIYKGGQAYDIAIEVWNTKAEYESKYQTQLDQLTIYPVGNQYLTIFSNTNDPSNQQIIATFKFN